MTPAQVLDHPVISERYFFPLRAPLSDPWIVESGGALLHGHRSAPHPGGPTLLHFHGNGEVVADWLPDFAPALAAAGVNPAFAEYRGYGESSGRPAMAAMLDDALAFADATGVPADQLVVYGRSVGSIYALHVAANRPVAGLVIESGIADVLQRLRLRLRAEELGTTDDQLQLAIRTLVDHRAKMAATTCPVLVLHTAGDDLVPADHGRQLAAWAGDRATLRLFPRGDHNTIHQYNHREIVELVSRFAREAVDRG